MELHAKFLNGYKEPALTIYGVGTLTMSFGMDISKAKNYLVTSLNNLFKKHLMNL